MFMYSGMKMTPKFAPIRSTIEAVEHSAPIDLTFIICTVKYHLIDFFFNHAFQCQFCHKLFVCILASYMWLVCVQTVQSSFTQP